MAVIASPSPPVLRQVAPAEPVLVPDLLHPTPLRRIDAEGTKLAIALAFASGVSGGVMTDALENAKVAPSTWKPESFAADLFLHQFVALCMKVRIGGHEHTISTKHLVKVLAHPPSDPEIVHHRRAVLRELALAPHLRKELERLYAALCRFRSLLEGATGIGKWDVNRRQLDILQLVKEITQATPYARHSRGESPS